MVEPTPENCVELLRASEIDPEENWKIGRTKVSACSSQSGMRSLQIMLFLDLFIVMLLLQYCFSFFGVLRS